MKLRTWKSMPLLVGALALLSACGNSEYQRQAFSGTATAGDQKVYTRPKVDIVFFQDDSDSVIYGPIRDLRGQMNEFARRLNDQVDYRFVVMPLLTSQNEGFTYSKYMMAADCTSVPDPSRCLTSDKAGTFNGLSFDQGWITTANSSVANNDYGFVGMRNNLAQLKAAGLLRADAPLISVVLTNGNDVEGAIIGTRDDGYRGIIGYNDNALYSHAAALAAFKGNQKHNFYPVIADGNSCYNAVSTPGTRYAKMASELTRYQTTRSSQKFSLCGGQLLNVLNRIYADAQVLVQEVKFDKAVISADRQPDIANLVVKKDGRTLPQSSTNGWTYIGYQENVPTSYYPTEGNVRSGFMIQLHGDARYQGNQKLEFVYL